MDPKHTSPTFGTDLILRTSDVAAITTEIPEGHRHLRTTLTLADGTSVTLQEATVAAIVRAYTAIKTHPLRSRIELKGMAAEGRKEGYAEWQLLEEE